MDRWHEEKEQDKNERNGRQSIIVVASLIDKVAFSDEKYFGVTLLQ